MTDAKIQKYEVSRGVFTQRNTPGHHDNEDRLIFHKQHYKVGDYHAFALFATQVLDDVSFLVSADQ